MPRLNDVAIVRQGMITRAKDVFIIDNQEVPEHEREIYQPFLPDAMIGRYAFPEETEKQVLYPFLYLDALLDEAVGMMATEVLASYVQAR